MENREFKTMVTNAIDALEQQGEVCRDTTENCVYLNEKGMCCIVGHMMPDNETRALADAVRSDASIGRLKEIYFPWCRNFSFVQIRELGRLQFTHDATSPHSFGSRIKAMREVAANLPTEE